MQNSCPLQESGDESTGTTLAGTTLAGTTLAKIGVYRTEDEFVQGALKLRHPFDSSTSVSDDAKRAMYWLLTCGPDEVKRSTNHCLNTMKSLKRSSRRKSADFTLLWTLTVRGLSMTNKYYSSEGSVKMTAPMIQASLTF